MDEHDRRRVGDQIEPGGRPTAPGRLELLQRFINSYNHDFPREWDRLGTPEKAQVWLQHKRLVGPDVRISAVDAARLRELREAIRALTVANQAGQPDPASAGTVRRASRTARLRVAVDDVGRTVLEPDRPTVPRTARRRGARCRSAATGPRTAPTGDAAPARPTDDHDGRHA
jgi:hypothetical protein